MSEIVRDNVPRGLRPELPKRPELEEDAWEVIQREQEKMKEREYVRFSFFKVEPDWRRLDSETREAHKDEVERVVAEWGRKFMVYAYSLVGTRGDADLLLWQAAHDLEALHRFQGDMNRTALAGYLRPAYSYFAMTKRSIYVNRYEREYIDKYGGEDELETARIATNPQGSRYLFVYPMAKTRAWYELSMEERQQSMDEHIRVGHQWPDVKLNTTYSYGLDDQEFVVAFESDHPGRFLDLLMALRHTHSSSYTLFDTPAFTCLAMSLRETLDAIG